MNIPDLIREQRLLFHTGKTKELSFRLKMLERLREELHSQEKNILNALQMDLGKSPVEGYMTELGMVFEELSFVIRHLKRWVKPQRVRTPLAQFPSSSYVIADPFGVVCILSPWNYPFLLSFSPLIGAVAAGNCVVLKPSNAAPETTRVIQTIIHSCFVPEFCEVIPGGRRENAQLLEEKFDMIFFTGSQTVGKVVMEAAAKNLTPVLLELGGKSPCIVEKSADLPLAAKRIVFGKFLNAGQTCVAPDYLLVQKEVKVQFVAELKKAVATLYPGDFRDNESYGQIVNEKHFDRLLGLLEGESILLGGESDRSLRKIAPTILDGVSPQAPVMQEEIFGPILPVLEFNNLEEAMGFVARRPRPLALYLFTRKREVERHVIRQLPFGGGCVNDTVIHLTNFHMGFGGVGESGMGRYHGKHSFDAFSNQKSILKKGLWLDLPYRYPPYTHKADSMIRRIMK